MSNFSKELFLKSSEIRYDFTEIGAQVQFFKVEMLGLEKLFVLVA